MNNQSQKPNQETDLALNAAKKAEKSSRTNGRLIQIFGLVLGIVGLIRGTNLPLILFGVVLICMGQWIQNRNKGQVQEQLDQTVVPQVLDAVFDNPQYRPAQSLSQTLIESAGLGLPRYTDCEGGQYVRASYRGTDVELSSVTLKERGSLQDEETGLWRDYETIAYQGQWMVCRLGVPMPVDLALLPRDAVDRALRIKSIKTDNEAFNKRFTVQSGNEPAVRSFLTSSRMESLLQAAGTAGGKLSIRIQTDGTLYAAVQSGHGFFDAGKGRETAPQLQERFTRELQWYTGLIDLFRPAGPT